MLLLCTVYQISVLTHECLMLCISHQDTVCLCEEGCQDPWLFFSKPKGVHEEKSLGNTGLVHCDVFSQIVRLKKAMREQTLFWNLMSSIYLLTRWSRVLLEKLTSSAASQEIPRIFGTRRFITVLTSARHLSLSWANSIQSSQPPPTSWRSILRSHLTKILFSQNTIYSIM